ncbi:hypothetical protein B566_EDAN004315 [Ephemera danica]|nr:hypothetical protein B566_EDAN004315 [Ephemera danica]
MADSASESDSSSIDGGGGPTMMPPSPVTREQLHKRIESLQQQNRVLKVELETYKLRVKALQEENRGLRQASVIIQARAEQEEEFISNTLLKKIQALKKEKETLAHHYEQEEECLTNDLSRKLNQLRQEKCRLEQTLEQEQECLVNKLMRKIEKLEAETLAKQTNLEQLRREKVELENTLEQEQEALVNRLWKRMDKLEAEKRYTDDLICRKHTLQTCDCLAKYSIYYNIDEHFAKQTQTYYIHLENAIYSAFITFLDIAYKSVALRELTSMGAADILTGGFWGAHPPEKARRSPFCFQNYLCRFDAITRETDYQPILHIHNKHFPNLSTCPH